MYGKCPKCGETQLEAFSSKNAIYCISCNKAYKQTHYQNKKQIYIRSQIKNKPISIAKKRAFIQQFKTTNSCKDCKKFYPYYVMDFDHLDGYKKEDRLSKLIADNYSFDIINREIAKCDLVCANCHHTRTHSRMKVCKSTRNTVLFVREFKHNKSCYDCGMSFPYWVLEFDHKPEHEKTNGINDMRYHASIEKIKQEIAKCDLVCANCHRERTYKRKNWPRKHRR